MKPISNDNAARDAELYGFLLEVAAQLRSLGYCAVVTRNQDAQTHRAFSLIAAPTKPDALYGLLATEYGVYHPDDEEHRQDLREAEAFYCAQASD